MAMTYYDVVTKAGLASPAFVKVYVSLKEHLNN